MPFSLVDSDSFRNILAMDACHRTKISTTVLRDLVKEFRDVLQPILAKTRCHVGFDLWSSVNHNHYCVSTIHWISEDWVLERAALDLMPLVGQAADDIVASMRATFEKFAVDDSLLASICTDGASNEVAAATFDGFAENAEHVWCLVHQLNLVVGDAYAGRCRARASQVVQPAVSNKVR